MSAKEKKDKKKRNLHESEAGCVDAAHRGQGADAANTVRAQAGETTSELSAKKSKEKKMTHIFETHTETGGRRCIGKCINAKAGQRGGARNA